MTSTPAQPLVSRSSPCVDSPRFEMGPRHFALDLHVGTTCPACKGAVPARSGGAIVVSWERVQHLDSDAAVTLTLAVTSAVHVLGWPGSPGWVELGAGSDAVEVQGVQ